jgi:hypothetical protein
MSDDTPQISLVYKPRSGPRRRVGFEPDDALGEVAYAYWRIEEVYSITQRQWREVGREHITDVTVTAKPVMTDLGVETQTAHNEDTSDKELLVTAQEALARAIELSYDDHPAEARKAIRDAAQRLEAMRNANASEVTAE